MDITPYLSKGGGCGKIRFRYKDIPDQDTRMQVLVKTIFRYHLTSWNVKETILT
jgi:hypothetical protein